MFENVEFTIGADQAVFVTRTNGDSVTITGLDLSAEQAAALAYLVNQPKPLIVEIKIAGD